MDEINKSALGDAFSDSPKRLDLACGPGEPAASDIADQVLEKASKMAEAIHNMEVKNLNVLGWLLQNQNATLWRSRLPVCWNPWYRKLDL